MLKNPSPFCPLLGFIPSFFPYFLVFFATCMGLYGFEKIAATVEKTGFPKK